MEQAFETTAEELEVHVHNGKQQQELSQGKRQDVMTRQERGKRPAEHVAHRDIEQRDAEHKRENDAKPHMGKLRFGPLGWSRARRRGPLARRIRHARNSPIARLLDCCGNRRNRCRVSVELDVHAVLQQVDGDLAHAFHLPRRLIDARLACRARHARDVECLLHVIPL